METERYSVPELLFTPQLIGLNQGGVGETTYQAINSFNYQVCLGWWWWLNVTFVILLINENRKNNQITKHSNNNDDNNNNNNNDV